MTLYIYGSLINKYYGFMNFLKHIKDLIEWNISKYDSLPSHIKSRFCFVMGRTLLTTVKEVFPRRNGSNFCGLLPCLACYDRSTGRETAKHQMATCVVWNNLPLAQKKEKIG